MLRAAIWFMASGVFWIGGALLPTAIPGASRWRLAALAIEYAGPFALFYVPFLGRSTVREWTISGHHMAERAALFIIVALGEGIVVTGRTFAEHAMTGLNIAAAFLIAFAGSVMMWWVYFDVGARRGAELIAHHAEPGRVARNAYTYLHMPIVAGIIAGRGGRRAAARASRRPCRQAADRVPVRRDCALTCSASASSSASPARSAGSRCRTSLGLRACLRRSPCGPGWSTRAGAAARRADGRVCWWWWRSGSGARSTAGGGDGSRGKAPAHRFGAGRGSATGPEGE